MLKIEVDMFSGRSNPAWIITDEGATKELLSHIQSSRALVAKPGTGFTGLGFREIQVQILADEGSRMRGVPSTFALASSAAEDFKGSGELAMKLVESMPLRSEIKLREHELTPLTKELAELVRERLARHIREYIKHHLIPVPRPTSNPLIDTTADIKCNKCEYEISQFNPGFWNNASTQPHNNCYNYGRNWRTNTFAQPGRAHGAQTGTMACNTVTAAAMADGLVKRCNPCLPNGEFPRRLMALVIDPGWDYHWYRHQRGGFWGHKPGGTAARNTDNSNVVITNPETCNRGGYTDFCGYFYAGKSVVIN
jgi:hypothetical protein